MQKDEIFKQIANATVINGNLGLFIGAGFSKAVFDDETKELVHSDISAQPLSWLQLLEKTCDDLSINFDSINTKCKSYPEIASEIRKKIIEEKHISYNKADFLLKETICKLVSWYPNKDQRSLFGQEIKSLSPNWIITTNYDLVIEGLLPDSAKSIKPNEIFSCKKDLIPIYHMHGIKTDPDSIIITNEDYIKLFRPDEYRQQRLPFLFMESTTLAIGYGIGDANVLTALDWKQNVYKSEQSLKERNFIQLAHSTTPKDPYDINGITVIETESILNTLREINEYVKKKSQQKKEYDKQIKDFIDYYANLSESGIDSFIDDDTKKDHFFTSINNAFDKVSSFGCVFLSRVIEQCWKRCAPDGAFEEYAKMLKILIFCMNKIDFSNLAPALFELIASTLNSLSYYIDISNINSFYSYSGKSKPAKILWDREKRTLPTTYIEELKNYANQRAFFSDHLKNILDF